MSVIKVIYHPANGTQSMYELVCSNGVTNFQYFNVTNPASCVCTPSFIDVQQQIIFNTGITMGALSILGSILSVTLILLITLERSLRTAFGINCLLLCLFDLILLLVILFFESSLSIESYIGYQKITDYLLGHISADNGFLQFLVRYQLSVLIPFKPSFISLMFITRIMTLFLRLIKAANRFVALYFPLKSIFNIKKTIYMSLFCLLVSIFIYTPLVIKPDVCNIDVKSSIYQYKTPCSIAYAIFNYCIEVGVALGCAVMDVASIVRLKKSKPADNARKIRRNQEIIMLIQNCTNLSVFVVSFVPFIVYEIMTLFSPCLLLYPIGIVVTMMSVNSLKITIGHAFDIGMSLVLMIRLARYNRVHAASLNGFLKNKDRENVIQSVQ